MPSLLAALRLRALIKEIFSNQEILKTATPGETVYVLEEIAKTNPYYVRAFLAEYVDFMETQPGDEETEEQVDDGSEEERRLDRSEASVSASMENLSLAEDRDTEKLDNGHGSTLHKPAQSLDIDEDLKTPAGTSGVGFVSVAANSELTSQGHLHSENPKKEAPPHKETSKTDPYELLCAHISAKPLPPTTPDLLQYPIDYTNWVSIWETPRVISGQGTTGARTWNAALLLGFVINTDSRFKGELDNLTVLELGAGTGLVATALAKKQQHNLQKIIITDGDSGVVEKLRPTLELNNVDEQSIECVQLLWGETSIPSNVDVVLGADIIYDPSVLAVLLDTLGDFFASGTRYAIISRSDRNPDTTAQWEKQCDERFSREVIRVENPQTSGLPCWFHSGANDITIETIRAR